MARGGLAAACRPEGILKSGHGRPPGVVRQHACGGLPDSGRIETALVDDPSCAEFLQPVGIEELVGGKGSEDRGDPVGDGVRNRSHAAVSDHQIRVRQNISLRHERAKDHVARDGANLAHPFGVSRGNHNEGV